jgi:hypothetical protein
MERGRIEVNDTLLLAYRTSLTVAERGAILSPLQARLELARLSPANRARVASRWEGAFPGVVEPLRSQRTFDDMHERLGAGTVVMVRRRTAR